MKKQKKKTLNRYAARSSKRRSAAGKKGKYASMKPRADVRGERRICFGIFHGTSRGYGFITPDTASGQDVSEDFFVPAASTGGAIDGDRVRFFVTPSRGYGRDEREEATVLEVKERAVTRVIAEFCVEAHIRGRRTVRRLYAIPENKKLPFEIEIAPSDTYGARRGDKIELLLTEYPDRDSPARGRVLAVFGPKESRTANYAAILHENGISTAFSAEVLAEAEEVAARRITSRGRLDLRDQIIFTIDGADAKDLDDAISLERTEQGWLLGVHIADVSHYVKSGSALDREAIARGTSVYFTDQVVPMLPTALSNGCCSLSGGVSRYTLSAFLTISDDGRLLGCEPVRSIIRSRVRGVYSEVNDIFARGEKSEFAEKYASVMPTLADMHALYRILADRSKARGALALETAEAQILLDENGEPREIIRRERGDAEKMIEQFMLAANEGIASYLEERGLPCVYRVHEEPLEDKMRAFAEYAWNLGLPVGQIGRGEPDPAALDAVLAAAEKKGIIEPVSTVLLRSLQKARYDTKPLGHFGLGIKRYAHFTSPIRRYPDLAVHRILHSVLAGKAVGRERDRLASFVERAAKQSSENELRALMAEREIEDLYKTIYMAGHIGEQFDARISSVTGFGLFAQLENTCEGLIPITSLDGYFVFDEKNHRLTCGAQVYGLGDVIRVQIVSADVASHKIEMRLIVRR